MPQVKLSDTLSKVCLISYDDEFITKLKEFCSNHNYKYYYIKHKPDIDNEKDHYHIIIESDSYHRFSIKGLVDEKTPLNLFEKLKNVSAYLRYMTHCDFDNKIHYDIKEIISNVNIETIMELIDSADPNALTEKELADRFYQDMLIRILSRELKTLPECVSYAITNNITWKSSWTFTIKNLCYDLNELDKRRGI